MNELLDLNAFYDIDSDTICEMVDIKDLELQSGTILNLHNGSYLVMCGSVQVKRFKKGSRVYLSQLKQDSLNN